MKSHFSSEADLCAEFLAKLCDGWTAYPETGGFDILLSRDADGAQVGVEAKLSLNAKVVNQALPKYRFDKEGPDYRAVLVPEGTGLDMVPICAHLGITVIRERAYRRYHRAGQEVREIRFEPELPKIEGHSWDLSNWHEWMPENRIPLPDYIPDVSAGNPSPLTLTDWKIRAIKLAILLETRPVTRADFRALKLSPARWTDPWTGWLARTPAGYVPGKHMPDFRAQHPVNYEQIKADAPSWLAELEPKP
jgi:hypothetical protein